MLGVLPFFPLVRLHRHAVAAAHRGQWASRTIRTRWMRKPSANWRNSTGHAHHQHADLLRVVHPEMHARAIRPLRYAIVGAEKLREPIAVAFKEKFGVDLLEGYAAPRWRQSCA